MFSFIKWFSTLMENAKKHKGLWFTLLSAFSLLGIFTSLYFVNFLVSDVAQKTYENQKNQYVLTFKNKILEQNEYVESLAIALSKNADIASDFLSSDENATKSIHEKTIKLIDKINSTLESKSVSVTYNDMKPAKLVGIDVTKKGTVFKSSIPMIDKNGTIISVVVDKKINTLVAKYRKEHKEFAFFLNESGAHKLDNQIKKRYYKTYYDKFYVNMESYSKSFLDKLGNVDFSGKLEESGFYKDSYYFYVYEKVYDMDGYEIGIAFIAEEVKDDNSFVNLVKNLVNSVTLVALGLIVSMLLFLF